jgi:hypothetical protein
MGGQDLTAADHRRHTHYRMALTALCIGLCLGGAGAVIWGASDMGHSQIAAAAALAGAIIAIAGLAGAIRFRPDEAQKRGAETGSYRDRMQRDWIRRITVLPGATLGITVIAMMRADEWLSGEDPGVSGVLLAGAAAINLLLIPLMLMGWDGGSRKMKRLLEDELTKAYRASAITCAFWVLMVGAMGVYLIGLWKPHVAVVALPMVLWVAAATAALRFAQLHRRAEREMADD